MKAVFLLAALASLGAALDTTTIEAEARDLDAVPEPRSSIPSPREVFRASARAEIQARDFFECSTGPAPSDADCKAVIAQVAAAHQGLLIASNSCVTYTARTCTAFFCALCQIMGTDTDFIAEQFRTAEALCVSGGQAGTVVGDTQPQWQAGFVKSGQGFPNYSDVC